MRLRHSRRRRRTNKQVLRHGWSAKASHRLQAGRTGALHYKRRKSKRKAAHYVTVDPTRTANVGTSLWDVHR